MKSNRNDVAGVGVQSRKTERERPENGCDDLDLKKSSEQQVIK